MTTYRVKLLTTALAQILLGMLERRSTQFCFVSDDVVIFRCQPMERAYLLSVCFIHLGGEGCTALSQVVTEEDHAILADKYFLN